MGTRRRGQPDALETSRETRWLVMRDRMSRPLDYQEVKAGSDLRVAMAAKRAQLEAAGWRTDSTPKNCAFFFADRENDRVCIAIECYEPGSSSSANWPRR